MTPTDADHDRIEDLVGAYALDAVDPDERAAVEAHLEGCPRCRAEVDAHRETAAALGNLVEEPPPGLWDRIAGEVEATPRRIESGAPPRLPPWAAAGGDDLGGGTEGPPAPIVALRAGWRTGRVGRSLPYAGAAAAAAAVVAIALLAMGLGRADHQVGQLQQAVAAQGPSTASTTVPLRTATGSVVASFAVYPDGRGVLTSATMAPLPRTSVYQLWAITGGRAISLGLMGARPHAGEVAFTWSSSVHLSRLAVTVEPAGGAAAPTTVPVASSGPIGA